MGLFLITGKSQMLYLIIRKVISNFCKTISLFLYCPYVVQFLKNYFQLSLPISRKNSLLCPDQSGFCQFDSCENQLLSTIYDIYANFLDISKVFDKVWHEGLLFKLEHTGISRSLLSLLKSFLSNGFQQVVLNSQSSS